MPARGTCDCTLCKIELRLLRDLSRTDSYALSEVFSVSERLRAYPSVASLLSDLKASPADVRSDQLLHELFAIRASTPAITESLLILTFLPMLHGTVRRVSKQQPGLSLEDISQQVLSFLLQYLCSQELQARQSHFAFAISRAVKRQVFEWAGRESAKLRMTNHYDGEVLAPSAFEEPFERYAFLRHFLHRCVTKGLLTDSELNLLIDLKLNGTNGEEFADFNGTSSNAVRQRLKRLLAKLRRLAR
jgi:DNA-directed RNA polymerase specialized sigma24 family protein